MITEARLNEILQDPKVAVYFQTLDLDVHEGRVPSKLHIHNGEAFSFQLPTRSRPNSNRSWILHGRQAQLCSTFWITETLAVAENVVDVYIV